MFEGGHILENSVSCKDNDPFFQVQHDLSHPANSLLPLLAAFLNSNLEC